MGDVSIYTQRQTQQGNERSTARLVVKAKAKEYIQRDRGDNKNHEAFARLSGGVDPA